MMDMPIDDIFEADRQFVCSDEMSTETLNIGSSVTDYATGDVCASSRSVFPAGV